MKNNIKLANIYPPILLLLVQISIQEFNLENDIDINAPTIQLQHDCAYILYQ
jgi:hypothetical protein